MTDKTTQSEGPFGPAAIAAHWRANGWPASRQYADKCIKKLGCPTHSLAAALEWRTARTSFRRQKGGGEGAGEQRVAIMPGAVGDSLDAMLDRVRGLEMQAFIRWSKAKGYDAAGEAKAYQEAMKTRINVESLVAAHHKKIGLVVDLTDAQQLVDIRLSSLRAALHSLDKELAKEFFPEDPAKYRPRFRRLIARVCVSTLAIARAKKRLFTPPADHVGDRAA